MNFSFVRRLGVLAALLLSLGCASSLVAQTLFTFDTDVDTDGSSISITHSITAGGTADFIFSSELYLQYAPMSEDTYHGLYSLGSINQTSGTALLITVTPGYVFDFHSFNYASEVPAYFATSTIFLDVTYAGGGTGSMSFDADDSGNPAFLGSLNTFANDVTSLTISTNGYAVINEITVSDIHQPTAVPEPATVGAILGAAALAGSIAWRRCRTA